MNNKGQMLMKVMVVNVMVMYLAFHSMRRRLPKTPLVSTEATPKGPFTYYVSRRRGEGG